MNPNYSRTGLLIGALVVLAFTMAGCASATPAPTPTAAMSGMEGMGPLGFQPDVFDNPPGTGAIVRCAV